MVIMAFVRLAGVTIAVLKLCGVGGCEGCGGGDCGGSVAGCGGPLPPPPQVPKL